MLPVPVMANSRVMTPEDVDSRPYRNAVPLPDGGPHGQRSWGYTADAVQQREAGACSGGAGHLTGEHREAEQGKAA